MGTKYTPGPWYKSSTGNHQGLVISEATGANVAVTYDEKDADLVAASLDLLEALENILRLSIFKAHGTAYDQEQLMKARAAIAKAKGETQ